MNQLMLTVLLAEDPVNTGPDFGKASPIGLVIVVLLLIAVLCLGWSLSKQLKKVPASFDEPEGQASDAAGPADDAGTAGSTGGAGN